MPLSQTVQSTGRVVAIQVKGANKHILRALVSLASAALLLRVGGMVNQVVVSASFGAGATMDAYFVAAAFPFLLIQLISSAIEAAVIPVYSQLRMDASKETASRFFSTLLNCLILGVLPLTLALLALRQQFVLFSAPGLDPARLSQAVALTPLLYLVLPLALVIGLLECVLNAEGQFGWPAYAGLLVPLSIAALTWLDGKTWGISVLCIGCLLGTVCQLAVVCVRAKQAGLRYRLVLDLRAPALKAILHAVWPLLLGALIIQGSPLIDQMFASTLAAGSISALNYALKLVSIFTGVIFVSLGRAALPYLARQAALGDRNYRAFKGTLRFYLWGVGLCTLALSLALFLLARPLVQILFQRGAFSAAEAQNTVLILSGFIVGLLPMALSFLLTRVFNALGETRVPMQIALVSLGANAALDALLAHFWQGLGIALATSVVYGATSLLLLLLLRRRIGILHLWQLPANMFGSWMRFSYKRQKHVRTSLLDWLNLRFFSNSGFLRHLLAVCITLLILAAGVIATARDALVTLRVASGLVFVLCFLRYPYLLLLLWASVNVGIGSSLVLFNGNNLDTALIVPLLLLLGFLPWKELCQRVPGLIWLVLYLGWVLVGIGLSPLATRAFLTFWLSMLAAVATGALAIAFVTTRRRLLGLINTLLATALLVALYGLYGYVTRWQGEVDPETLLFRVTSLFTQATTFSFYLSLVIPLAFYRCMFLQGARKLVAMVVALLLLAALLLTFTRSAYISVFLEVLIMACCLPTRKQRLRVVGVLVMLCVLVFLLGWSGQLPFLARFFNGDVSTFNGRIYLWQALLSHFQVTQWLGNGLQSSDQLLTYLRVGSDGRGVIGTAPHNLFLGTLYDHGVTGLLLLCSVFLSQGVRLLKGIRESSGERRMLYAVALAALFSVLVQSLGSRDLWIQAVGVSFWIVTALPFARCWPHSATTGDRQTESGEREPEPLVESRWTPGISYYFPE